MQPHYADDAVTLYAGDCLDVLSTLPDNSVDAVVTDPPYSLSFMSAIWDTHATPTDFQDWCTIWAMQCLRVLKPGGHLLAFGGTRTWHRLTCAIEDAGFEIRDSIAWLYGSGFPKSLDVSKAIDRQRNDRPDIVRVTSWLKAQATARGFTRGEIDQHMGTSDMAGWWLTDLPHRCQCPTWEQWETLKRFMGLPDDMDAEVWRLNGRKGTPGEAWDQREQIGEGYRVRRESAVQIVGLSDGAYAITAPATADAQRWQGWGTALKPAHEPIVVARKPLSGTVAANVLAHGTGALNIDATRIATDEPLASHHGTNGAAGNTYGQRREYVPGSANAENTHTKGRWPANVALDETAAAALDHMSGESVSRSGGLSTKALGVMNDDAWVARDVPRTGHDDLGGASRFYFTAKAGSDERITHDGVSHPTVKPLSLMRWLVRLVTPPGGLILEPFAGSGTTVEAAILEGFRCIAIEREADYLPLITQRLNRRRNPVAYLAAAGEDLGLFDEDAS